MSSGSEIDTEHFPIQRHDELTSNSTCYMVLRFIGEGSFGKVAECVDLKTGEKVAMKMVTGSIDEQTQWEVDVLELVGARDQEQNNFVRLIEHFKFKGVYCLVLEMLERNLLDEVFQRGLYFNEIRSVSHQLFQALETLKAVGIIHADLKPDNVMFVNLKDQPFKVKVIDFGLALPTRAVHLFGSIQPYGFRSPESLLGLPLSEAADMWGVGCIMAFVYFGIPIFPQYGSYYMLREMVRILGQPDDHLLNAGKYTWKYFSKEYESTDTTQWRWRLKSPQEYEEATGDIYSERPPQWIPLERSLEWEVLKSVQEWKDVELEDGMAFLSLLKQCLHWDAEKRITPGEALKHSFITMAHLVRNNNRSYIDDAVSLMTVCHLGPLNVEIKEEEDVFPGFFNFLWKMAPDLCDDYVEGPPVTTELPDEDDNNPAALTQEESAAASNYDNTGTDYVPAISETNDGGAPAVAGPTDGALAVVSSAAATKADHRGTDCLPIVSNTYDDGVLATAGSSDGASGAISSNDGTATVTKEKCALTANNTYDGRVLAPYCSTDGAAASISLNNEAAAASTPSDVEGPKKKKKNRFHRALKFFQKGKIRQKISSQENSKGPSTTLNFHGGGRDTAAPTTVESAASTDYNNSGANFDSSTDDDGASAPSCSTGAAASISSNDEAAAAVRPVGVDDVKKEKKNLFRRALKFFHKRQTRPDISNPKNPTGPSTTSDLRNGVRDTAALAQGDSAAATSYENTDAYLVRTPRGASAALCSADGATASTTLNDEAAAALTPVDAVDVKKKMTNVFQRTFKTSSRAF